MTQQIIFSKQHQKLIYFENENFSSNVKLRHSTQGKTNMRKERTKKSKSNKNLEVIENLQAIPTAEKWTKEL